MLLHGGLEGALCTHLLTSLLRLSMRGRRELEKSQPHAFELSFVLMEESFKYMTIFPSSPCSQYRSCALSSLLSVYSVATNRGANLIKLNEDQKLWWLPGDNKASTSKGLGKAQKHKHNVSIAIFLPSFHVLPFSCPLSCFPLAPTNPGKNWFFPIKIVYF